MIEGESLRESAKATAGEIDVQAMEPFEGTWSGEAQLWWLPQEPGARLTLQLNAPASREYALIGYFTQAPDYGDVRIRVNGGAPLPTTVKGYSVGVRPTGPVSLGRVKLNAGANRIELEVIGKDTHSTGYLVGIDGFVLKP
jgi:hypothetical protein